MTARETLPLERQLEHQENAVLKNKKMLSRKMGYKSLSNAIGEAKRYEEA